MWNHLRAKHQNKLAEKKMEDSDIIKPGQTMITSFAKGSAFSKDYQCASYMATVEVIHFSFIFSFYMEYDLHI